jgi:hypothetical protein
VFSIFQFNKHFLQLESIIQVLDDLGCFNLEQPLLHHKSLMFAFLNLIVKLDSFLFEQLPSLILEDG